MRKNTPRQRGFVVVAFTLALFVILGAVGLAFDIGRMYITRSETQSFCDSAAISAALKLDGAPTGIAAAKSAVSNTLKGWQFGTQSVYNTTSVAVSFGKASVGTTGCDSGSFVADPADPTGYVCAKVTVPNAVLSMLFMPVLTNAPSATIAATATAKQLVLHGIGDGLFPFAPYERPVTSPYIADAPVATIRCASPSQATTYPGVPLCASIPAEDQSITLDLPAPQDAFGMIPAVYHDAAGNEVRRHGGLYTLRWSNGSLKVPPDANDLAQGFVCPGDYDPLMAAIGLGPGSGRGYIWPQDGASVIRDNIENSVSQDRTVTEGQTMIPPDTGTKQTEILGALNARVARDPDPASQWYVDYLAKREANGTVGLSEWRVVLVPITTGQCGPLDGGSLGTLTNPCTTSFQVVNFAKFFLQTTYDSGGNKAACGEYVGTSTLIGGGAGAPGPGIYVVRLVQ